MHPHKKEAMKSHEDQLSRMLGDVKGGRTAGMSNVQKEDDFGMPAAGKSSVAKFKRGGAVHDKPAKHRLDRKKRADGGSLPDPVADAAADEYIDSRAAHARGGKVRGKGGTKVNVIIQPQGGGGGAPMPPPMAPPMMPPGPPPPPPGGPPGGPGGGIPPQLLAALAGGGGGPGGPGGPPPGMPPGAIPRATGGRVMHMTVGTGSGEGRLEQVDHYEKKK